MRNCFFPEKVISSAYREKDASYFLPRAARRLSNLKHIILVMAGLAGEPCGNIPRYVQSLASVYDSFLV